jgi:hypothetical protein
MRADVLYRILLKSDNKFGKYGQKYIYSSMSSMAFITSIFVKPKVARYIFVDVCSTEYFLSGIKTAGNKANFINAPNSVQLSPHQVLRHSQLLNDIKYRTLRGSPKK